MNLHAIMENQVSTSVRRLQWFTVGWMSLEVIVSFIFANRSSSVALLGFGGDSLVELFSAFVVILRFGNRRSISEAVASKIASVLLIALALFIVFAAAASFLLPGMEPRPSYPGLALLIVAAVMMPWLARRKRALAMETRSSALAADSIQSSMCGYLAWIALAGLTINALFRIPWADPIAGLGLIPIILREAREAWKGQACECD